MTGGCHCGALRVELETARTPSQFQVRACQCSFCRRHGALSISDPQGRLTIRAASESALLRYQFGLRTADFLICARCGVYVGALSVEPDGAFAIVNPNVLDERAAFGPAEPVSYDGEDAAARRVRRRVRWTPAALTVLG